MKTINQRRAYGLALLAVLFWSTISSALKITLRFMPFDVMLFWTVLFAVVFLFLINRFSKEPLKFKLLNRNDYLSSALMGLINPFFYYLILFKAYDLLEAQVAGALNYTWPIVLTLLSIPMLKQKLSWKSLGAIAVSFIGILFVSSRGHSLLGHIAHPFGVVLAVGSAFFWALYWILNMKDKREDTGKLLLNLMFGLVYMLIYFLVVRRIPVWPDMQGAFGVVYIALFEMSLTYVIWLKALKSSGNVAKVSNLIYLSPFIGLFWIRNTVGEAIHFTTIVGLTLIVLGIVLQQFIKQKKVI
ncbi:MAG: DMT family transporter [Bacteroidales bacterium]|nr:DMT family transporter [Bacteroidales bacterium]